MNSYRTFWMVWCENGGAPNYKHGSRQDAEKEAERLAVSCPDRTFHVLESVAACKKMSVVWAVPDSEYMGDGVPF